LNKFKKILFSIFDSVGGFLIMLISIPILSIVLILLGIIGLTYAVLIILQYIEIFIVKIWHSIDIILAFIEVKKLKNNYDIIIDLKSINEYLKGSNYNE
jgi:hypothetical protein